MRGLGVKGVMGRGGGKQRGEKRREERRGDMYSRDGRKEREREGRIT